MKHSTLCVALGLSLVVLIGCNDSGSSNESSNAVYSGVTQDDSGSTLGVQVILESSQSPVLTLSDDRDHLTNYIGTQSGNSVTFSAAQLSCDTSSSTLQCQSANGDVQLQKQPLAAQSVSDFEGSYQALWDESLYSLTITAQGEVTLNGDQCSLAGTLAESKPVENLIELNFASDDCGLGTIHAYAFLHVENESLYSIDLLTDQPALPISWVRI
ncbi:hypothetical protein [Vibrio algivorus]|uniref:Lipoprotein n=1 Tax=Vibrio algivorus TaxID=1667024 RepID=A0A557NYD4_9VIBR|nr:hypothetical protein [Vibrio algivorus]TVO33409.1 hypothetical protein FOF44_15490 [Vibrio algivorus]